MAFLFRQVSLGLLSGVVSGGLMAADVHQFEFGWQDKYITQGRNNLPDSDLFSVAYQRSLNESISGGFWYARSEKYAYNELHLGLNYHLDTALGEFGFGYERLIFDQQKYDNELIFEWSYGVELLSPSVNMIYSTDTKGLFIDVLFSHEFSVANDWQFTTYFGEGFDFGYLADGNQGLNHFQLGADGRYSLSPRVNFHLAVEHGIIHSDLKKQGFQDETWITLGLQTSF